MSQANRSPASAAIDESLRLYYLDKMGIQCWQSLAPDINKPVTGRPDSAASVPAEQPGQTLKPEAPANTKVDQSVTSIPEFSVFQQQVASCVACGLHRTRQQAIAGQGNLNAKVMVLLLHPARSDDAAGELGSGEEGELLNKMLSAIGISVDDVYLTSLLKCHVPSGHTISAAEVAACRSYLDQQIEMVKPDYLVVMGDTTARCLLNKDLSIDQLRDFTNRESAVQRYGAAPVMVTYSPRELLDNPANKRKAWTDLQKLQKWLNLKAG